MPAVVFFSVPKLSASFQLVCTEATFPGVTRNAGANDVQVQTIGPTLHINIVMVLDTSK